MSSFKGIEFTDEHVVNLDEYIPLHGYNPQMIRPWLIHNGFQAAP